MLLARGALFGHSGAPGSTCCDEPCAVGFREPPPSPGLQKVSHLIEQLQREGYVDPVSPVLKDCATRQFGELVSDFSAAVGAGPQMSAALPVNVAAAARNNLQIWVFYTGVR